MVRRKKRPVGFVEKCYVRSTSLKCLGGDTGCIRVPPACGWCSVLGLGVAAYGRPLDIRRSPVVAPGVVGLRANVRGHGNHQEARQARLSARGVGETARGFSTGITGVGRLAVVKSILDGIY
jgi:hypothetical protein